MTFDSRHYVPVLKVKRGEKKALQLLTPAIRAQMTPLLEIVEMNGTKALAEHLKTSFADFAPSVVNFPRYFLDAREIAPEGPAGAAAVFQAALAVGVPFAPVTGISRTVDVAPALAYAAGGLVLRLTRTEFEAGNLTTRVTTFLNTHGLVPERVDLVVDLGAVENMVADGIASLADAFLADVPWHTRWRTFTVSGCAFPKSMQGVGKHSHAIVDRAEWMAWRDGLHAIRGSIPRLPTFSDCAIQHPEGVEGFDPLIMQVSASVRYALIDQWLLMKGESTRNVPPSVQFPNLAVQLVYGHLSHHFAGPGHCAGCQGMQNAADGHPKLGSAEAWRRRGTIHHLTRAVQTLQGLTWP